MPTGLWIALAAVVLALAFGAYRALTDGRFRGTHEVRGAASGADAAAAEPAVAERTVWDDVVAAVPDAQLGERATFVQFSSAFCAPCRATRRTLSEVVELVPGERLVMRTTDGPFPMETTYTWAPEGEGTRMTLANRGRPSGFAGVSAPVMALAVRRATRKDLALLKAHLER